MPREPAAEISVMCCGYVLLCYSKSRPIWRSAV